MAWIAICDKTGLLTDVIAASPLVTDISALPKNVLASVGATCGVVSSLLSVIEKQHKSLSKRYHTLYTQSCVAATSLQDRISAAVNDKEFIAEQFKALEETYWAYLYSAHTEV